MSGRRIFIGVLLSLAAALPAGAAIVTFDIVPTNGQSGGQVTVRPGTSVQFQLVVNVVPSVAGTLDNNGLSFFSTDIITDLGTTPTPVTFSTVVGNFFTVSASRGTASGDDLIGIGAGQNNFTGNVQTGVGQNGTVVLATGTLVTPNTTGTFNVDLEPSTTLANVFAPNATNQALPATVQVGPGFTIVTDPNAPDNGDDDDNGGDDDDDTPPTTQPTTQPTVTRADSTSLVLGLGLVILLALAFLLGGPYGGAIVLLLLPLLVLLINLVKAAGG